MNDLEFVDLASQNRHWLLQSEVTFLRGLIVY